MKCYNLETIFSFGKYKGNNLHQVFNIAPSYVDWCLRIVRYFIISKETFNELKKINPKYQFSTDAYESIISNKTEEQSNSTYHNSYDSSQYEYMRSRIDQHPELQYRSEHEAINLLELADEIGCDPEDLTANLDM